MVGTPTKRENNFAKKKAGCFHPWPLFGLNRWLDNFVPIAVFFFPLILDDNFLMVSLNNCVLQILLSFRQNRASNAGHIFLFHGMHCCDPGTRKIGSPEMTGDDHQFFSSPFLSTKYADIRAGDQWIILLFVLLFGL